MTRPQPNRACRPVLENDLRVALEEQQLELHYQPQIDLETEQIVGAEALLRWNHPDKGMISPAEFIPLAEETALIIPIGRWVIEEACRQAKLWQDEGQPPIPIAVNVSVIQFHQHDLVEQIRKILEDVNLPPERLGIEITESVFAENIEQTIDILNAFKNLGVEIALDDFGTGYSSLSYLTKLPIDKLKIDQAFVRSTERDNWSIVRAVVQLSRSLGLKIVAEGVETLEHAQRLHGLGCQIGQGFHYSQPLSSDDFKHYQESMKLTSSTSVRPAAMTFRLGLPIFYVVTRVPGSEPVNCIESLQTSALHFWKKHPEIDVSIRCDESDLLVEALLLGELDVIIAAAAWGLEEHARQTWSIELMWVAARELDLASDESVPLVLHPEGSPYRTRALEALNSQGRSWRETYQSPLPRMLQIAISSGLGVGVLPLSALNIGYKESAESSLIPLSEAAGWPKLGSVEVGIYCLVADPNPLLAELIETLSRVIDGLEGVNAVNRRDPSAAEHPSDSAATSGFE